VVKGRLKLHVFDHARITHDGTAMKPHRRRTKAVGDTVPVVAARFRKSLHKEISEKHSGPLMAAVDGTGARGGSRGHQGRRLPLLCQFDMDFVDPTLAPGVQTPEAADRPRGKRSNCSDYYRR
jgi:hypothetical protein